MSQYMKKIHLIIIILLLTFSYMMYSIYVNRNYILGTENTIVIDLSDKLNNITQD